MLGANLGRVINAKYDGSFTLFDALNDPKISENMEKFYVPRVEMKESIFIKKDESIAVTNQGPKKIRFIYLNPQGKNVTNPDSSYIQIPQSGKGFLARISLSGHSPENLEIDYFVDISNIKYTIDTVLMTKLDESTNRQVVVSQDVIHFQNLEFYDYSKVEFDRWIKEFIFHKGQIFATYFR